MIVAGESVTLNGSGSRDPDGMPLTYEWSIVSLPEGSAAILSDPLAEIPSFQPDLLGQYVIQLHVNDGTDTSLPDSVVIIVRPAVGEGILVGEVFDDSTGLPVAQALVAAKGFEKDVSETQTDARGRYRFVMTEGEATVDVAKDGYTTCHRQVRVSNGAIAHVLDARLTPVAPGRPVSALAGGSLALDGATIMLYVPPGAFSEDTNVSFQRLSGQGLPGLLPTGWAPVCAVHVGPEEKVPNVAVELTIGGLEGLAGKASDPEPNLIVAQWSRDQNAWVRIFASIVEGEKLQTNTRRLGFLAVVKPDNQPFVPPIPDVGSGLAGMSARPVPEGTTANIAPSPKVLFSRPGAKSEVSLTVDTAEPVASGTRIEVDFAETYERSDLTRVTPEPMAQDFVLYQTPTGVASQFVASPSMVFDPALLKEGVIDLTAHRPVGAEGESVVTPEGGLLSTPDGVVLTILPGSVADAVPARAARLSDTPEEWKEETRFECLGGVGIELAGVRLAVGARLMIRVAQPLEGNAQVLVVKPVQLGEITRYELVGTAKVTGTSLRMSNEASALPFPGIRDEGRYYFVRMTEPVGFVTGSVTRNGTPLTSGLVEADGLPFVIPVNVDRPRYVLANGLGSGAITGWDLIAGGTVAEAAELQAAEQIVTLDLVISAGPPVVALIIPADGATAVRSAASVVAQFSAVMNATTITTASLTLSDAGGAVEGSVTVVPDRRAAVFRPGRSLISGAQYTVWISNTVQDAMGQPLSGNQPDGSFVSHFTTADTTPPALPEPGQITLTIPEDGSTEIRGTQGTVEPGTTLFIFNLTHEASTAAVAEANGSFYATLAAQPEDLVILLIQDQDGNRRPLPYVPFSDGAGRTVLNPRGGEAVTPQGIHASVLPNALVHAATVRLKDVPLEDVVHDLPPDLTPVQAFEIEAPADVFNTVQRLAVVETGNRFPAVQSYTTPVRVSVNYVAQDTVNPASRFTFVAKSVDALGAEQSLSVAASGAGVPCATYDTVTRDEIAPRLRFTAPTCLGPSEAFSLEASATQPRFDVWLPAPEGTQPGDMFSILRKRTAGTLTFWLLEETAGCTIEGTTSRIATLSQAPWGIRGSGGFVIASTATPLAFVEGTVAGPPAIVGTDVSSLAAMTTGRNGAFLLPVPANSALQLRIYSAETGAILVTVPAGPFGSGSTNQLGLVGPNAPHPLTVTVNYDENRPISTHGTVEFSFSEPLDPSTLTPANLFIANGQSRSVAGDLRLVGDGSKAVFVARRPWRIGERYEYRVTRAVMAMTGAQLAADATGFFTGFVPSVVGQLPGENVREAATVRDVGYFIDGNRLRSAGLLGPGLWTEGVPVSVNPIPNRLLPISVPDGTEYRSVLMASSGTAADYGRLVLFRLDNPLAPVRTGSVLVSSPPKGPTEPGVPALSGTPDAMVSTADSMIVSNQGIGLQRLPVLWVAAAGENTAPSDALAQYPVIGAQTYTKIAASDRWLVSIGREGVQVHDPGGLAPVGTAAVTGTPLDLEVTEVDGRLVALVAAGLPGGVQVFEISSEGSLSPVAMVLPGCAVTRVIADGVLKRAWLACSNQDLWVLSLADIEGMEKIDLDADGEDDRLGSSISMPGPIAGLALDAARSLGLVCGGASGLYIVQLGPTEAAIVDVVRDPVSGDFNDSESITDTGRVFSGDYQLLVTIETRLPPGQQEPQIRVESDASPAPVVFGGGATEQALQPGRNDLVLKPAILQVTEPAPFTLRVVDGADETLASYAGAVYPIPMDQVASGRPTANQYTVDPQAPPDIAILGRTEDGRYFNITSRVPFTVANPAILSVATPGEFDPHAGGTTQVYYELNGQRHQFEVTSTLPPQLAGITVEPYQVFIREPGGTAQLGFTGVYTDGSTRALTAADAQITSQNAAIVTVDAAGLLTAQSEGDSEINAAIGDIKGLAYATVAYYVPPDISEIVFDMDTTEAGTDQGVLPVLAWVQGTGSLGNLPVTFDISGIGGEPRQIEARTMPNGLVSAVFHGLNTAGSATLTARVINPADNRERTASQPVSIVERNRDAEPNDSMDEAVAVTLSPGVRGSVSSDSDSSDVYRLESFVSGELVATLATTTPETQAGLTAGDETGAELGATTTADGEAQLTVNVSPGKTFVTVAVDSGATEYDLTFEFHATVPSITAIVPASGQPGDVVTIQGAGFDVRDEGNVVLFNGVVTEVRSAQANTLTVVVPAFATDGPVTVNVGDLTSNGFPFATGVQGDPRDQILRPVNEPNYVKELFSDGEIADNRLQIGFKPSVTRVAAEALAQELHATIIGLMPLINLYYFEFPNLEDLYALYRLKDTLRERADVEYVTFQTRPVPNGFYVNMRDNFTGVDGPIFTRAYDQVHMFEAWDAITSSGFFNDTSSFYNRVDVGVLDTLFNRNANNTPQFDGIDSVVDLNTATGRSKADPNKTPLSHGTHVAGIIGARNVRDGKNRSVGILAGVVPATVKPEHYYLTFYDGLDNSEIAEAFAVTSFLDIMNISMGWSIPRFEQITRADLDQIEHIYPLTDAQARVAIMKMRTDDLENTKKWWRWEFLQNLRILLVCSAGNNNQPAKYNYPAALASDLFVGRRVIAVAAVGEGLAGVAGAAGVGNKMGLAAGTSFDQGADTRASFSNYGDGLDIAAPGTAVLSVDGNLAGHELKMPYAQFDGTSAAAPMVTGVAALLKSLDRRLTASEIKQILVDTATPIDGVPAPMDPGWGDWAKPRRLDALAAVQCVLERLAKNPPTVIDPDTVPYAPGNKRHLWVADTRSSSATRIQILEHFESAPNATLLRAFYKERYKAMTSPPYNLAITPSGDKVYVGRRQENSIYVYSGNTMELMEFGGAAQIIDLSNPSDPALAGRMPNMDCTMAVSPNGKALCVPLTGQRIAVVDTRQDAVTGVLDLRLQLGGAAVDGEICAVAFDSWNNLLAVSNSGANGGTLILIPYRDKGWADGESVLHMLTDEEPRGIAVQPVSPAVDYAYVCYGGADSHRAATGFAYDPRQGPNWGALRDKWNISDRIAGRGAFVVRPGGILPASPEITRQKDTATNRAFDIVVDNTTHKNAYLLYYWTANVGYLKTPGYDPFRAMDAVTEVGGRFEAATGNSWFFAPLYESGFAGLNVLPDWAQEMFLDGFMYINTEFPLTMALDQQGALLATGYVGEAGKLRLFFTDKMGIADDILHTHAGMSPAADSLDDAYSTIRSIGQFGLSYDFPLNLWGVRDVAFGPQLSILTPQTGTTYCGVITVNVTVRDPEIMAIACTVRRQSDNATRVKIEALTSAQRRYGYIWKPAFVFQPEAAAAFLEQDQWYDIEVAGSKLGGRQVIARTRFYYHE